MGVKQRLGKLCHWIDQPVQRRGSDHGPAHRILVGTHHKSGSHWMMNIFKAVCAEYALIYYSGEQKDLPRQFDVFFQDHSQVELDGLGSPFRGVHLIRDPRDIIISAAFFHQHAKEAWLHAPLPYLNGQTYQQALNRCQTLDEKILFEMEYTGRHTVNEMLAWNYANPHFIELKYEDLIMDVDLRLFQKLYPSPLPKVWRIIQRLPHPAGL